MVFSSLQFIYVFFPIFLLCYALVPVGKSYTVAVKNAVLFIGSLVFYAWGEPLYVFLMLFSIAINFYATLAIADEHDLSVKGKQKRKVIFVLTLIFDVALLFVFKYIPFIIRNVNHVLELFGQKALPIPEITQPIGISFYSFQIISYLVDIYRRRYPVERNIIKLGTYITMFPQLIAGPIVTFPEVNKALEDRKVAPKNFDKGLKQFILGLSAKVLIANRIGILWSDIGRIGYESISTPLAWMGAFAYSFQIYFDFMGYSLMAIGLGRMLGFKLPRNFDDPYASRSASEFWRRWHITLGRWFREYIYIPLGGSRQGTAVTVRNLFIVWLFTGMWHGADWNFIIWGMLFFVLLLLERGAWGKLLEKWKWLSIPYMLLVIPVSWVIFALSDLRQLGIYLTRMFPFIPVSYESNVSAGDFLKYAGIYWLMFAIAIAFSVPAVTRLMRRMLKHKISTVVCVILFFVCVYFLAQGLDNPFLYYRF